MTTDVWGAFLDDDHPATGLILHAGSQATSEALLDLTIAEPNYPLQLAVTNEAFDAIEEALALVSKDDPDRKRRHAL